MDSIRHWYKYTTSYQYRPSDASLCKFKLEFPVRAIKYTDEKIFLGLYRKKKSNISDCDVDNDEDSGDIDNDEFEGQIQEAKIRGIDIV